MRIVALLTTFNEERFIAACLDNLVRQGVEVYLCDNSSTDRTVEIARGYLDKGLIDIETYPRNDMYSWRPLLQRKEELAATLEADWFMHVDADEMRLPPRSDQTLAQAFADADRRGYNAVNFRARARRAALPVLAVLPAPLKRLERRPTGAVKLAWSGGHKVKFSGLRMCPESFRMRHYLFLSVPHAIRKFVNRHYDPAEVSAGMHTWRAGLKPEMITLPKQDQLRPYLSDDQLDASKPRKRHYVAKLWYAAKRAST